MANEFTSETPHKTTLKAGAKRRFSAEHKEAWLEEFDRSGLTVERFCKSKGTTARTFYLPSHITNQ